MSDPSVDDEAVGGAEASTDDGDLIPQSLMTPLLWVAIGAVAASFVISFSSTQTVNGVVVDFKDYGAAGGGGLAILLGLLSLKDALSPLAGSQKLPRLGIIAVVAVLGAYRLIHGLGLLV